jgi:ankyrin repeat protein
MYRAAPRVVRLGDRRLQANAHGITPLHDACATGATDKVKPLVRIGADVHATNKYYTFYPLRALKLYVGLSFTCFLPASCVAPSPGSVKHRCTTL